MHLAKEQLRKPWIMNCISPPFPALWRIISDIEMHLDLDLDRWHLQSVLPIICYAHKITWILPSIIHPSYLFENGRNQLSLRSSHKSISRYEFWQNKICKVSSKFQFGNNGIYTAPVLKISATLKLVTFSSSTSTVPSHCMILPTENFYHRNRHWHIHHSHKNWSTRREPKLQQSIGWVSVSTFQLNTWYIQHSN